MHLSLVESPHTLSTRVNFSKATRRVGEPHPSYEERDVLAHPFNHVSCMDRAWEADGLSSSYYGPEQSFFIHWVVVILTY